jgi:hypothetical protein
MQHALLIAGIKSVTDALDASRLREALNPRDGRPPEMLLDALRRYSIAAARFTSQEEVVADLLGLAPLENTSVWARLLGDDDERLRYHDRVGFVTLHLPRFVELLEESSHAPREMTSLCVTAVADGIDGLTITRLVTIANSLHVLYTNVRSVEGLESDELTLANVDAGADTLLWFEGEPEGLALLKELLTNAFRWLALFRERALEHRLADAKENLPTIQRIREQLASGSLEPDEATRLEHDVLTALLAFFDAGALIPEMERDIRQRPRDIVTPPPPSVHASRPSMRSVVHEIEDLPEVKRTVPPTPGSEAMLELERDPHLDDTPDVEAADVLDEETLAEMGLILEEDDQNDDDDGADDGGDA